MKIGDYVRMSWGISKVSNIYQRTDGNMVFDTINGYQNYFTELIKSSPNIIDLIDVGDLIRIEYYSLRYEERVTRLFEVTFKDKKYINLNNSKCDFMLIDGDFNKSDKELEPIIKSIVTKEQFSSMEYKIGDE